MRKEKQRMRTKDFITIDDILLILKEKLGLEVSKAAVYGYIARKGFPENIGLGSPRLWRRSEVIDWVKGYSGDSWK